MARRARGNVAPLRRSSADRMPASIRSLSVGVGCRHPITVCGCVDGRINKAGVITAARDPAERWNDGGVPLTFKKRGNGGEGAFL